MIYDFKINRILFIVGWASFLILAPVFYFGFEFILLEIVVFGLLIMFVLKFIMRRNANRAYQYLHQKLYLYGDAKTYLEHMETIYKRKTGGRRIFQGVKLQNLVLALIFAGDFERANTMNQSFKEAFEGDIHNQPSMRFSNALIQALFALFNYDKDALEGAYQLLQDELSKLKANQRYQVESNPYSVYYMIDQAKKILDQASLTIEQLDQAFEEKSEFFKACIAYAVNKNNLLEDNQTYPLERQSENTLFYLDQTSSY